MTLLNVPSLRSQAGIASRSGKKCKISRERAGNIHFGDFRMSGSGFSTGCQHPDGLPGTPKRGAQWAPGPQGGTARGAPAPARARTWAFHAVRARRSGDSDSGLQRADSFSSADHQRKLGPSTCRRGMASRTVLCILCRMVPTIQRDCRRRAAKADSASGALSLRRHARRPRQSRCQAPGAWGS